MEPDRFDNDDAPPAKAQVAQRVSGRLRRPECLRVWREHTRDPLLLKVLTTGLELPLMNGIWPAQYDCMGNHIPAENLAWARKAVQELEDMGSVAR